MASALPGASPLEFIQPTTTQRTRGNYQRRHGDWLRCNLYFHLHRLAGGEREYDRCEWQVSDRTNVQLVGAQSWCPQLERTGRVGRRLCDTTAVLVQKQNCSTAQLATRRVVGDPAAHDLRIERSIDEEQEQRQNRGARVHGTLLSGRYG